MTAHNDYILCKCMGLLLPLLSHVIFVSLQFAPAHMHMHMHNKHRALVLFVDVSSSRQMYLSCVQFIDSFKFICCRFFFSISTYIFCLLTHLFHIPNVCSIVHKLYLVKNSIWNLFRLENFPPLVDPMIHFENAADTHQIIIWLCRHHGRWLN